jgi:transcription elongation factor GreA
MSLPIYVTQDKWQDFDDAWTELMASADAPLDELYVALRRAGEKKRITRCVPLVKQHVELLDAGSRHADAANLLGTTIEAGASAGDLAEPLLRHATAAWGEKDWWARALELTGLESAGNLRQAWTHFVKLQRFQPGAIVFHPSGWGAGEITEVTDGGATLHVTFQNGRRDHFPIEGALDIFEVLDEEDLRARYFRDPEGLKKEVKKDPLDALRAILKRYHGRASSVAIKNAMAQVGVEGSAFSAWWRKAKTLAENSEWFRLTGSGKKIDVHLLLSAADPADQIRRQLTHAASLEEVVTKARALLGDPNLEPEHAAIVHEALEAAAADEANPREWRLAAWMLLREKREETPEALRALLDLARAEEAPADDATHVPAFWALLQELPTTHDQEQALSLLIELEGEGWVEAALENIDHAPPGMVRSLVERLMTAKKQDELGEVYRRLLTRVQRAPHVLLTLARYAENGKLGGELPAPLARAQAYANLAAYLFENRRVDAPFTRAHTRIVEFLTGGDPSVLEKLLEDATASEVRSIQRLTQRGVEETVDNLLIHISTHAPQDDGQVAQRWFWDEDVIWTTRSGKDRTARELKELKEVKMPENEEAIARAAAMGDLSENSEWDAALEEKRNLSSRAQSMETDLARAALLENAILPEGVASPGTAVRYRELGSGEENRVVILGPWDDHHGSDVVSYRAPLAQGLLGLEPGTQKEITLPGGTIEVEVLEVEPVSVD